MLTRRQVLVAALALLGVPPLAASAGAQSFGRLFAARATAPGAAPRRVLVDRRHADSRRFGHALALQGAALVGFDGELSAVWQDLLAPTLFAGGGALAGLTTPAALCCLERLASGRGLRVVSRSVQPGADAAWRRAAAEADAAPLVRWVIAAGSAPGLAS
jgi:hypothetical protein